MSETSSVPSNQNPSKKPGGIFWKTSLCRSLPNCSLGSACRFAHSKSELMHTDDKYKTSLCWTEFRKMGKCKMGNACRYAHSKDELKTYLARREQPMRVFYPLSPPNDSYSSMSILPNPTCTSEVPDRGSSSQDDNDTSEWYKRRAARRSVDVHMTSGYSSPCYKSYRQSSGGVSRSNQDLLSISPEVFPRGNNNNSPKMDRAILQSLCAPPLRQGDKVFFSADDYVKSQVEDPGYYSSSHSCCSGIPQYLSDKPTNSTISPRPGSDVSSQGEMTSSMPRSDSAASCLSRLHQWRDIPADEYQVRMNIHIGHSHHSGTLSPRDVPRVPDRLAKCMTAVSAYQAEMKQSLENISASLNNLRNICVSGNGGTGGTTGSDRYHYESRAEDEFDCDGDRRLQSALRSSVLKVKTDLLASLRQLESEIITDLSNLRKTATTSSSPRKHHSVSFSIACHDAMKKKEKEPPYEDYLTSGSHSPTTNSPMTHHSASPYKRRQNNSSPYFRSAALSCNSLGSVETLCPWTIGETAHDLMSREEFPLSNILSFNEASGEPLLIPSVYWEECDN